MTKIFNQNVELKKENEDIATKVNQTMSKVTDFENGFIKEFSILEAEINDLKKVFFNGYSTSSFGTGTVRYSGANANVGRSLDINTGIFTPPSKGFYFFQFQANVYEGSSSSPSIISQISIKHNGKVVSRSQRHKVRAYYFSISNLRFFSK